VEALIRHSDRQDMGGEEDHFISIVVSGVLHFVYKYHIRSGGRSQPLCQLFLYCNYLIYCYPEKLHL
jgi:hypothetical protein